MGARQAYLRRIWVYGLAGAVTLGSLGANASGFALMDQSVSSMGTAYANGSAGLDDASTIFFNPATMTRLAGKNATGGVHIVHSNVEFSGKAFYNPDNPAFQGTPLAGAPIDGKQHDSLDLTAAVPHGAYSYQYNDRIWLGVTVNGPFGLKTEYNDDWVGRYNAIKSELIAVNINPSFGYKINEHASVGFGVSAMYADGELTQAVDGGLATASPPINVPPGNPPFFWAPGSDTYDGKVKLTGNDWGYGFNLGILLEASDRTRLGLAYRSKVDLNVKGNAKVSGLPPPLDTRNGKQNAKLDISLPDSLSLSGLHQLTSQWTLMADVTWTNWSKLDQLDIRLQDGRQSVTPMQWNDSMRYSLGATYKYSESWLFRTGVAYDETPVPNSRLRSARVPDASRTWLAVGANFRVSKQLSFDFGYAHEFVDDPDINSADAYDPSQGQTTGFHKLKGSYDASVDIFSAQVNWRFK
jgi:long-chain fatty acid transport protein